MTKHQLTRNQHTVPQCYLDEFTEDGKYLFVFDKPDQRSFKSQPKAVANATFFYDFHTDVQQEFKDSVASDKNEHDDVAILKKALDPQLVEHALGQIEAEFSLHRDKVIRTIEEQKCIHPLQKEAMAYFVTIQLTRTPRFRREFIEMMNQELIWMLHQYPDSESYYIRYDERRASLDHAHFMFSPQWQQQCIQALCKHIWFIGVNDTEFPLYTSDTPVIMKAHSGWYKGVGLGVPGIEIAFPLTKRYLLDLLERSLAQEIHAQDCTIRQLNEDRIMYYNRLQVLRSTRQVYCSSNNFDVAKQTCQRFPNICDPNSRIPRCTRTLDTVGEPC
jgi:uncharacterized protein DUF4238